MIASHRRSANSRYQRSAAGQCRPADHCSVNDAVPSGTPHSTGSYGGPSVATRTRAIEFSGMSMTHERRTINSTRRSMAAALARRIRQTSGRIDQPTWEAPVRARLLTIQRLFRPFGRDIQILLGFFHGIGGATDLQTGHSL